MFDILVPAMHDPFQNYQHELESLLDELGVTYLGLFGSRARGDHRPDSDYDFLVDFQKHKYPSLIEITHLENRLTNLLGQEVDLVTKKGMSKYIRPYIKPDLKVIYETS